MDTIIVFCPQLLLIVMMLIVMILFSLSKIQNDMFLLLHYMEKIIKNYQDLKDQFFGINIKQKVRGKMRQMNIDIFSNQILLELIDFSY